MALSPQAQQILAEYNRYKETNLDRDVDRQKVLDTLKKEEQKAINVIFDTSKTIRAERNFEQTFGRQQYEQQLSRTNRVPADQREREAADNYGRGTIRFPNPTNAIERFINEQQRQTNIRIQREETEQLFFEEQEAFTEQQQDDIEAAKIRIKSQTEDLQTKIRTKEQFEADSAKIRNELQDLHYDNHQRWLKRESYPEWNLLNRKWQNYWRSRQPRYRGQGIGNPPPMTQQYWYANSENSLRRDILYRQNMLKDYAREQTTFDNARGIVDNIRQQLDRLSATQVITPAVVLRIDTKIKEATMALEKAAREKILKWSDGLSALAVSINRALEAKKLAIQSNIPEPPVRKPESVFAEQADTTLGGPGPGIGEIFTTGLESAISGLAAAFNPSEEDLVKSYLATHRAQREAMKQIEAEGGF